MPRLIAPLLLLLCLASSLHAQTLDPVRVSLVWNDAHARPGDRRVLALVLDMEEKWHVNPDPAQARPVGDFVPIPTTYTATTDPRLTLGAWQAPPAKGIEVDYADGELLAWSGRTVVYLPVTVGEATDEMLDEVPLSVTVRYQACDDKRCLAPRTVTLDTVLRITQEGGSEPGDASLFVGFDPAGYDALPTDPTPAVDFYFFTLNPSGPAGLAALLLLAAAGGFLLNLTPCVLPVIPIKVLSLSRSAGTRGRTLGLGGIMCLGIVAFWLLIGSLIAFVSGFGAINALFQQAWFTLGVGLFIAVMAVGMCGVFGLRLPQAVYRYSPTQESAIGSFGYGVMTAVLSTPCTAPFMGAAAAWAATQAPAVTLATFASIGGGMALPYLLLAAFPQLVARVPRSGPGSELIKQVMGLLMLAAAAYFIGIGLNSLTPLGGDWYWWAVGLFIALAGAWALRRGKGVFVRSAACLLILLGAGVGYSMTRPPPIDWVPYSERAYADALAAGKPVMLDFTADWCLNCKVLEKTVLYHPDVVRAIRERGVVPLQADITSRDTPAGEAGYRKLAQVGRVAIPLLVIIDAQGREVFKADAYSVAQVLEALGAGAGSRD